jgi:hypothetical protein
MSHSKKRAEDSETLRIGRRVIKDPTWYNVARELMVARIRAGMLQRQVAARMHTSISAISRLENAAGHRPTLATLEAYAAAVEREVQFRLVPRACLTRAPRS